MRIIADLHIHSRFSRATSSKLTAPSLDYWARIKGINLIGTGDCTHPQWLTELREQLEESEEGLYTLKKTFRKRFAGKALLEGLPQIPAAGFMPRFVLSGEISTIYKRDNKTRKIHHLVLLPDFKAAAAFQTKLAARGNITSDGRPILGLDSRDLLELLLETDERTVLIPAHIWTPWFSVLGARSGFDSIDECYRDLSPHIHAVETGLSSNPPMNWAVASLDRFSIISNSDAHSPEKLGREAAVLEMELSYPSLVSALNCAEGNLTDSGKMKTGTVPHIIETIEFFPQEGKYHYDGHRKCGIFLDPEQTRLSSGLCPVCGKTLTQGVMRRVLELADNPVDESAVCPADVPLCSNRRPYRSLIPLKEILSELTGMGSTSKKVSAAYNSLIQAAGNEFNLLCNLSLEEIAKFEETFSFPEFSGRLAESIRQMRTGNVLISPGYDGEYGIIHVFPIYTSILKT